MVVHGEPGDRPAGPLHLGRNLLSDYAQLAAAPTGNGAELFAVVAAIYARVPAGFRLAPPPAGRWVMRRRCRSRRDGRMVISAVAAGIALTVLSGHQRHPRRRGGRQRAWPLGCAGLEALWESAGGSRAAAFTAAEIAMAESSGRQYASLVNTNGTTDRGYWQINSSHGSLSTFDANGNARAAVLISSDGADWSPWVTWQTGARRELLTIEHPILSPGPKGGPAMPLSKSHIIALVIIAAVLWAMHRFPA